MEKITKINSINKAHDIEKVAQKYKLCLAKELNNNKNQTQGSLLFDISENSEKYMKSISAKTTSEDQKFIQRVNLAISFLDSSEQEIIWFEFFFRKNDNEKYFLKRYRRSTYYRKRQKAINDFHFYASGIIYEVNNSLCL